MGSALASKSETKRAKAPATETLGHSHRQVQHSTGAVAGLPRFLRGNNSADDGSSGALPQVQARCAKCGEEEETPGSANVAVQNKCACCGGGACQHDPAEPAGIHRTAQEGVKSANQPLPYLDRIQSSFGRHDVSAARTSIGGQAAQANESMGSLAYTAGDRIAFRRSPDINLVAHEATHVVQQRSGAKLAGGVGRPGDVYERQADAVAEAVERNDSAEPILDRTIPGGPSAAAPVVQHKVADETPGFDSEWQRTMGAAPETYSAFWTLRQKKRKRGKQAFPELKAAVQDFIERFPFLQDVTYLYQDRIAEVFKADQADYKEAMTVDTKRNWARANEDLEMYSGLDKPSIRGDRSIMPESTLRYLALDNAPVVNKKRTEEIPQDWVLGEIPPEPQSGLSETDDRTFLREAWKKFKSHPAYLAIDGWSERPIALFISDGIVDWEIKHSGRLLEMDDLLAIDSIHKEYLSQGKNGPKRAQLGEAIQKAQNAVQDAENDWEMQRHTNATADELKIHGWAVAPFPVVGISEQMGGSGFMFSWLVAQHKALSQLPAGPGRDALFARAVELYDENANLGGAGAAFSDLLKQYEDDIKADMAVRKNNLADPAHWSNLRLNPEEKKEAHNKAFAAALEDWEQAPDELPAFEMDYKKSFYMRASSVLSRASASLDNGNLENAAYDASLALEMARRFALQTDRYRIRVGAGAGTAVKTLKVIKIVSHIILTVSGGAKFAQMGLDAALGAATVGAADTAVTSWASGEGIADSIAQGQKEFITGLLMGRLTEEFTSVLMLKYGLSRPVADVLANIAASPAGEATNLLYEKAMDPNAPIPSLDDVISNTINSSLFGILVSAFTHVAGQREPGVSIAAPEPTGTAPVHTATPAANLPGESKIPTDPDTTAKPGDFTPKELQTADRNLEQRIGDPKMVREVGDKNLSQYDLEVDVGNGEVYRRNEKNGTWCLFRNPVLCGKQVSATVEGKAEAQKAVFREDGNIAQNVADRVEDLAANLAADSPHFSDLQELRARARALVEASKRSAEESAQASAAGRGRTLQDARKIEEDIIELERKVDPEIEESEKKGADEAKRRWGDAALQYPDKRYYYWRLEDGRLTFGRRTGAVPKREFNSATGKFEITRSLFVPVEPDRLQTIRQSSVTKDFPIEATVHSAEELLRLRGPSSVGARPHGWVIVEITDQNLAQFFDTPIQHGTIFEFPDGSRVWRTPDNTIASEGALRSSIGRRDFEGGNHPQLRNAADGTSNEGVPVREATGVDHQRAHPRGQFLGFEMFNHIPLAPTYVNQELQARGIELYLSELRRMHDKLDFRLSTEHSLFELTNRQEWIDYHLDVMTPGGRRSLMTVRIGTDYTNKLMPAETEIRNMSSNEDDLELLESVDMPAALGELKKRIRAKLAARR